MARFVLTTKVFSLSVKVTDGSGGAVNGVYVIIYNGNTVQGFNTTNTNGVATFQLPIGNYTVKAFYTGSYWLTQSTGSGTKAVFLASSGFTSLSLSNYPPAFTSTNGFLLIVGVIVAIVIAIGLVIGISRRKT
jgi:hypothetical protein